ncbi:developmental pluripotency-associated protein 2-like [Cricetulus griseus]|uniref:Developmental pluripotency-associated protein 2-like n=1 Tax=Cricetulus griseus TaxID=10029 RepID=A0A9J7EZN2_CRIGR|nr:developmental pluripotency-associated protein 2-like [Cricetulus griseus]XP_027247399.1 developmental pluripotency-associated protein 2-like [Cricetulus griseus]
MSLSSQDAHELPHKQYFKEEFDEDEIILALVPATEEEEEITGLPTESVWSTMDHRPPVPPMTSEVSKPEATKLKPRHPSLPSILPPITEVSQNTLREWCRFCNLSTDGKKVEVYLRLQQHSYSDQQCLVPQNSLEAKMKPKSKMVKKEPTKITIKGLRPQDTGIVEVMTPRRESILAAWGRITNRASLPMVANRQPLPSNVKAFLPPAPGVRWCVVEGKVLPANKTGWVRLQMKTGHTWVPDSPQRMILLFLLPACVLPEPGVEDNLLCPECVERNRRLMRNFKRDKRNKKKHKILPSNLPP